MENLFIEKTKSTPYVLFDAAGNHLSMAGESFPENAAKFYAPILEWVKKYLDGLAGQSVIADFEIIYFNSSTSKVFMMLFDLLDAAVAEGKNIRVNWICNEKNETAIECGEEFKEDLEELPFNIVIVSGS